MSLPPDRPNLRDAGRISAIVMIAMVVIALQFAVRLYALDRVERFATEAAEAHLTTAASAAAEGFGRQIDSWVRVQEIMEWFVRNLPDGPMQQEFIARRLRQLTAAKDNAISSVALYGPGGEWHLGAGPEARPATDGRALPARGFLVDPPILTGPDAWLIALGFSLPPRADGVEAYGVITLDGKRLSDILGTYDGRPGQRVGLWRGDGSFLAGTVTPAAMVARKLVSPLLPGPDGRLVRRMKSPIDSDQRLTAVRALPGLDLFLTVSVALDREMALFEAMERTALILEATVAAVLLAGMAVLISVVRARGRAQLALARAEADRRLAMEVQAAQQEVLEGVDAGVYVVTIDAHDEHARQEFNSGTARLIRRPREELQAVEGVIAFAEPPVDPAELRVVVDQLRRGGVGMYEARIRCGDGQLRWFRFQLRVVRRDGETLRCIGLMTDIETEKAATAAAVLAARLATLGELSAGIAHEMKQPLGAIALIAETMQLRLAATTQPDAADLVPRLTRIAGLVERASSVTEHLRAIARNQDGGETAFDLEEAVDGALLLCGFALRDGGVRVDLAALEGLPPVIGHQVLVEQVLMNLLMNARDAMADTAVGLRHLRVAAVEEGSRVRLIVRDSGPGIPSHVMPRLFEPFFTTKPVGVGTGLGLSICASILKACGGDITATNPAGGGAEFTISLLAMPEPADAAA